jgi:hypothetical protein
MQSTPYLLMIRGKPVCLLILFGRCLAVVVQGQLERRLRIITFAGPEALCTIEPAELAGRGMEVHRNVDTRICQVLAFKEGYVAIFAEGTGACIVDEDEAAGPSLKNALRLGQHVAVAADGRPLTAAIEGSRFEATADNRAGPQSGVETHRVRRGTDQLDLWIELKR